MPCLIGRTFSMAAAMLLIASPAIAGEFPQTALLRLGFVEARAEDFSNMPDQAARQRSTSALLSVSADFNNDRQVDEARLMLNRKSDEAWIVVTILRPEKLDTYVLRRMPLASAAHVGIEAASGGIKVSDLRNGSGEVFLFNGEEFRTTPGVTSPP